MTKQTPLQDVEEGFRDENEMLSSVAHDFAVVREVIPIALKSEEPDLDHGLEKNPVEHGVQPAQKEERQPA